MAIVSKVSIKRIVAQRCSPICSIPSICLTVCSIKFLALFIHPPTCRLFLWLSNPSFLNYWHGRQQLLAAKKTNDDPLHHIRPDLWLLIHQFLARSVNNAPLCPLNFEFCFILVVMIGCFWKGNVVIYLIKRIGIWNFSIPRSFCNSTTRAMGTTIGVARCVPLINPSSWQARKR